MTIWRHLYDPNTDTHYTNGGYIPEDAATPVDGWQWRQGYAPDGSGIYEEATPGSISTNIKDMVSKLDEGLVFKYAGQIAAIGIYLNENNLTGAMKLLLLLLSNIDAAGDTETKEAAQPIVDYLTQLGVLKNA